MDALAEYVRVTFGTHLPDDYREFLRASDGYDGDVGGGNAYLRLWPASGVPDYNDGYESQCWMPGFLMIGDAGGLIVYGIDLRDPETVAYVETDYLPMSWDSTFGRDASLYDFLLRLIARQDAQEAGEEDAK